VTDRFGLLGHGSPGGSFRRGGQPFQNGFLPGLNLLRIEALPAAILSPFHLIEGHRLKKDEHLFLGAQGGGFVLLPVPRFRDSGPIFRPPGIECIHRNPCFSRDLRNISIVRRKNPLENTFLEFHRILFAHHSLLLVRFWSIILQRLFKVMRQLS